MNLFNSCGRSQDDVAAKEAKKAAKVAAANSDLATFLNENTLRVVGGSFVERGISNLRVYLKVPLEDGETYEIDLYRRDGFAGTASFLNSHPQLAENLSGWADIREAHLK